MKIAFLFTCYNRIEKTSRCITSIKKAMDYANEGCNRDNTSGEVLDDAWFIVDAGSKDGTPDRIKELIDESKMHARVEENAFYSQGMRVCMDMARQADENDLYILINDDVEFYEDFLTGIIKYYRSEETLQAEDAKAPGGQSREESKTCNKVLVGATDDGSRQTYGGVRYDKDITNKKGILPRSIHYRMVSIDDDNRQCHTFNANCVVIPATIFKEMGSIDSEYVHGLGDFDYGMCIYEKFGKIIETSDFYVGKCSNNSRKGTWMDTGLSRKDRIRKLNEAKGSPTKIWFYYLKKHFGTATALCYSISPYIRIMLGK